MAASKTTAVHISLIIFVMLFIISSAVAYMYYDDGRELRTQMEADRKEKDLQKTAALKYNTQLEALKVKIGHSFPEVGDAGQAAPTTVLGAMTEDIKKYSLTTPQDYKTALQEVWTELQTAKANLTQEQATTRELNQTIATLRTQYEAEKKAYETERDAAVTARVNSETEHMQALQAERDLLAKLNTEHSRLKVQMQEAKNAFDQGIAEKEDRINRLVSINNVLQDRIEEANQTTFERPDGLVQWVDNTSHLVWINLGSADNLPKQTNFSVYRKGNRGVGRDTTNTLKGPEDMIGAIEVTRILGPHLAEARILDEDYYEPIGIGDPIYTPVWGANQSESFAFVGLIDIDNDGRSDRDYIHDILTAANAKVQTEVDDEGNRTGGDIDERTKFLVVGEIPNLEEIVNEKERDAAIKIGELHKKMKEEAREQGVRVVTLNDFMAFMGVKPKQRVFRPGDDRPFNLKHGARSTATSQTIGNRQSSGQTSGLYSRSKRLRQPTSTGQTSGAYSGSR